MVGFSFVCFRSRVERVSFRVKGLGVLCGLDIFAGGGEGRVGWGGWAFWSISSTTTPNLKPLVC